MGGLSSRAHAAKGIGRADRGPARSPRARIAGMAVAGDLGEESPMKRTIASEMTPAPVVVSTVDRVSAAYQCMRACRAHHLPVVRNGCVAGIVTQHDLDLCTTLHPDPDEVLVAQAMRA